MRGAARAVLAVRCATPAAAQLLLCSPPPEPYCVGGYGPFSDEWHFRSCRSEIEQYRSQMRTYLQCLADEREEAIRKLNQVVDAFNRRARS